MKEPMQMLLEILLDGGRVTHDGYEYAMAEDGSLCVIMKKDDDTEVACDTHCTLSGFKRMADSMKDDLWLLACANQLRKMKQCI